MFKVICSLAWITAVQSIKLDVLGMPLSSFIEGYGTDEILRRDAEKAGMLTDAYEKAFANVMRKNEDEKQSLRREFGNIKNLYNGKILERFKQMGINPQDLGVTPAFVQTGTTLVDKLSEDADLKTYCGVKRSEADLAISTAEEIALDLCNIVDTPKSAFIQAAHTSSSTTSGKATASTGATNTASTTDFAASFEAYCADSMQILPSGPIGSELTATESLAREVCASLVKPEIDNVTDTSFVQTSDTADDSTADDAATDATADDATTESTDASDSTTSDATTSDSTTNDATTSDATTSDATTSDSTTNDATTSDATTSDATTSDATTDPTTEATTESTEVSPLSAVAQRVLDYCGSDQEVMSNDDLGKSLSVADNLIRGMCTKYNSDIQDSATGVSSDDTTTSSFAEFDWDAYDSAVADFNEVRTASASGSLAPIIRFRG